MAINTLKRVIWHPKAKKEIQSFPKEIRYELGYLLHLLQKGENLEIPFSKPMSSIIVGAYELRIRGKDGIYRVFYYLKKAEGIIVFHCFKKKSQKTPRQELNVALERLKEFL